ncbi:MAG: phosphoribosylamine--glycine ligase [Nitrospirota bacterium]|nr:phosphoribosylamine--glycine ligase [Nitrospirota bacterium]
MKILVIGSGGREHAICWKLSQSPKASKIYCAPGNAGIASVAECVNIKVDDIQGLLAFAKGNGIDLTIVGPELPLTLGVVDLFEQAGLRVFGPSKAAAQLEGSKAFAKGIMEKYSVPTARYGQFSDVRAAEDFLSTLKPPYVIKADGLAAGKGVIITDDIEQAAEVLDLFMIHGTMGDGGRKVVIEEFLEGEEASLLAFCDGEHVVPMVAVQDHKRIFDNDLGPNTGGMGTYSPAPVVTPEVAEKALREILIPTVKGMAAEGMPYKGILYAGLMIHEGQPKTVEFNCRFGDPETQVLMMRLDTDLVEIVDAAIDGRLDTLDVQWKPDAATCVVMAAGGYPEAYEKGKVIEGLNNVAAMDDAVVFHAGTADNGGKVVTSGGRVLGVTALGGDIRDSIDRAYEAVGKIQFEGMQYRKDIGRRALTKKETV